MQKEFIGKDSLKKIKEIVNGESIKNVFLVTGKASFQLSGAGEILKNLLDGKNVTLFNSFQANPLIDEAEIGINLFNKSNPDIVIAVGGGSVLDMAKLIKILAAQNNLDYYKIIKNPNLIINKGVPLVAIPTTAGSGSQSTHFAVVYVNKNKYSLAHKYMLPEVAIVDPVLTYNTPKIVAASSAMDALSQAVESYWSAYANSESKVYAAKSIKLILRSIKSAVLDKDDFAMSEIALASHLAGKAINITKTTAPHAMSYILTSKFNIPHGHAVSLFLAPAALITYKIGDNLCNDVLDEICNFFECASIEEFYNKWIKLMHALGLTSKLKDLSIDMTHLDLIVSNVNIERLKNHPTLLNKKDLEDIVEIAIIGA